MERLKLSSARLSEPDIVSALDEELTPDLLSVAQAPKVNAHIIDTASIPETFFIAILFC